MTDGDLSDDVRVEELYRQYGQQLRLFALSRGLTEDAEDLVHETFARAIQGLRNGDLKEPSKIAGWLHGIFRKVLSGHWRKKSDRERLLPPGDAELLDRIACVAKEPEIALAIAQALRKLPRRYRLILLLNVKDGRSTREIAQVLGRAEGTVGKILAEAKQRFRHHFTPALQEPERPRRLSQGERRGTRE